MDEKETYIYRKEEDNIYYDSRCKNTPYCLGIMRSGIRFTRSYATLEEAQAGKAIFIASISKQARPRVSLKGCRTHVEIIKRVKKAMKEAGMDKYSINEFVYEAVENEPEKIMDAVEKVVEVIHD